MFIEQLHNVVSSGDVMVNEIPALVDLIASATQLVISNPNATNVEVQNKQALVPSSNSLLTYLDNTDYS